MSKSYLELGLGSEAEPTPTPAQEQQNQKPNLSGLRFIAAGTEGATVIPAIPNFVNGKWENYPDNITKIYFNKNQLNQSYTKQMLVKNITKNNRLRMNKYKTTYKRSNLPNSVLAQARLPKNNSPLYLIHMPNLGKDMIRLLGLTHKQRKPYYQIPLGKILNEILKVMKQVKEINEAGYIHGDIRDTNFMIDKYGNLTIIDYGLFNNAYDYYRGFQRYFASYYNPPEAFLSYVLPLMNQVANQNEISSESKLKLKQEFHQSGYYSSTIRNLKQNSSNETKKLEAQKIEQLLDIKLRKIREYAEQQNYYFRQFVGNKIDENDVRESIQNNFAKLANSLKDQKILFKNKITPENDLMLTQNFFINVLTNTFDSYGLGLALNMLFFALYSMFYTYSNNDSLMKNAFWLFVQNEGHRVNNFENVYACFKRLATFIIPSMVKLNLSDRNIVITAIPLMEELINQYNSTEAFVPSPTPNQPISASSSLPPRPQKRGRNNNTQRNNTKRAYTNRRNESTRNNKAE